MGLQRACVKYSKVKGGVYRCAKFQAGKKFPVCPPSGKKNVRSAFVLHPGGCAKVSKAPAKKKTSSKRRSKR